MIPHNAIKNWQNDEQPREKMLLKGKESLSDAELIGILIGTGTRSRSAIDLAKDVLELATNNVHELGKLTLQELMKVKGIGEAKAVTIAAALELGRRRQAGAALERKTFRSPADFAELLKPELADLTHETFWVVYLNAKQHILKMEKVFVGGITQTIADLRVLMKSAVLANANSFVVAHNHPSGNLTPSKADKQITERMKEAGTIMDIKLIDHIIVAGNEYFSFHEEGLL